MFTVPQDCVGDCGKSVMLHWVPSFRVLRIQLFSMIRGSAELKQDCMKMKTEWLQSFWKNGKLVLKYDHSL